MARRRWVEWASARMLCALVREGARVHAAAGVRTVAPPVFFCPAKRVRGRPAFFGPRYQTSAALPNLCFV